MPSSTTPKFWTRSTTRSRCPICRRSGCLVSSPTEPGAVVCSRTSSTGRSARSASCTSWMTSYRPGYRGGSRLSDWGSWEAQTTAEIARGECTRVAVADCPGGSNAHRESESEK